MRKLGEFFGTLECSWAFLAFNVLRGCVPESASIFLSLASYKTKLISFNRSSFQRPFVHAVHCKDASYYITVLYCKPFSEFHDTQNYYCTCSTKKDIRAIISSQPKMDFGLILFPSSLPTILQVIALQMPQFTQSDQVARKIEANCILTIF